MFYNGNGEIIPIHYNHIESIAHRGYSAGAPENTLEAFILARQKGFTYVECDVTFTSDRVPVLLHDASIDRTSNGSGHVASMTYAEISQYDFGSWFSPEYEGAKIPTFAEFLTLCRCIGLHPHIELKNVSENTEEKMQQIVAMVEEYGMKGNVTYVSFDLNALGGIKAADPAARLGVTTNSVTEDVIASAQNLKCDTNEVFISSKDYGTNALALCKNAHFPLAVWLLNSAATIKALDPYITGVTSDSLHAGQIIFEKYM